MLYNGIEQPSQWPPGYGPLEPEPMPVPYLVDPPELIPIDVGRQLFVDDFLIEHTTLRRTFHRPEYHPDCPVIAPDQPWECKDSSPMAAVFSDGVWYDPSDELFKMWYCGGDRQLVCYATSKDGIQWEKPSLDIVPGTNILLDGRRDSNTVWLDHEAKDPSERFKMFLVEQVSEPSWGWALGLRVSGDGIHWSERLKQSEKTGDRTTVFYNPFRRKWVISLRIYCPETVGRARDYIENADPVKLLTWGESSVVPWVGADWLDPHHANPEFASIQRQLYNLDAAPYESLMLGFFAVWQGPENDVCGERLIHKRNELLLGFSRDGFHWHRPDRRPFLPTNEADASAWNWGNVQSAGGGCLIVGDKLYIYCSGRRICKTGWDGNANTGLAILRRDGFASMDSICEKGELTTRTVQFSGKRLFVNIDNPQGELAVEVLEPSGNVIEPFTLSNCVPVSADRTLQAVEWKGGDLSAVGGRPVKFRFHLRNGSLYSFWVSPDASGASHGYVAAGGPGFDGATDTVGGNGS